MHNVSLFSINVSFGLKIGRFYSPENSVESARSESQLSAFQRVCSLIWSDRSGSGKCRFLFVYSQIDTSWDRKLYNYSILSFGSDKLPILYLAQVWCWEVLPVVCWVARLQVAWYVQLVFKSVAFIKETYQKNELPKQMHGSNFDLRFSNYIYKQEKTNQEAW